jgi:micrococcal nuclease
MIEDYSNYIFTYNAKVIRVVDGDTIYAEIDLGFHVKIVEMFRFSKIDTPEIYRPRNKSELKHGQEAKIFLENLILDKDIVLVSKKTGKYGRWIADIYLETGENVQDLLIENGFEKRESYEVI